MYIVMRTYDLILGTREEFIQHVQERLVPLLKHVPGFRAFSLAEAGDNHVTFISTFDTLADAKASARMTRGWIAEHTGFFIQEVTKLAAGQLKSTTRLFVCHRPSRMRKSAKAFSGMRIKEHNAHVLAHLTRSVPTEENVSFLRW